MTEQTRDTWRVLAWVLRLGTAVLLLMPMWWFGTWEAVAMGLGGFGAGAIFTSLQYEQERSR